MNIWEKTFKELGFKAQREWPNESLIIFIKKNFKAGNKILELGCGGGGNMWFLPKVGMDAYGIDISPEGVKLCQEKVEQEGFQAKILEADMQSLPFECEYFNGIVDVVSLQHVENKQYVLEEVWRCLKPGGKFFSYHLSGGDIDKIFPEHTFYFPTSIEQELTDCGFQNINIEKNTRTYNNQKNSIEYSVITADKSLK